MFTSSIRDYVPKGPRYSRAVERFFKAPRKRAQKPKAQPVAVGTDLYAHEHECTRCGKTWVHLPAGCRWVKGRCPSCRRDQARQKTKYGGR